MDHSERMEVLTLLQLEQGMRLVEVKFGPLDRDRGYPHAKYDDDDEYDMPRKRTSGPLKSYTYKCHDPSIQVGDVVVVEVGYFYGVATVTEVHTGIPYKAQGLPLKYVLSRADVIAGARYADADKAFMDALARSEASERLGKLAANLGLPMDQLKTLAAPMPRFERGSCPTRPPRTSKLPDDY